MADPTNEELQLLPKFRELTADLHLKPDESTDLQLLKWIRAREWDLKKANEMLRASLNWRKEKQFDKILDWKPPPQYLTDYDYDIEARDPEGRPVIVVPFGLWDVKKAVTSSAEDMECWLRYVDQLFARAMKKMKEVECLNEVTQFIIIADCEGIQMKQLMSFSSMESYRELVRRLESNYPETIYKVFVINASRVFSILFNCVKPFMTARTLAKLSITTSSKKWIPALLEVIPKNQLLVRYGGTRERDFRKPSKNSVPDNYDVSQVGAGQKVELKFNIPDSNSKLVWKFRTENYDIGFYLNYNLDETLVPFKRYDTNNGKEEIGSYLCVKPGDYFLVFDNSYSKMRSKTVYYNIDLQGPDFDG